MLEQILQPLPLILIAIIAVYSVVVWVLVKKLAIKQKMSLSKQERVNTTSGEGHGEPNHQDKAADATHLSQTFRKFVPKQFVDHLSKHGSDALELGRADEDELAILFTDIRGFTGLSEKMSPQELMNFLNSYFMRMNDPIHKNKGFIDKFIGDAVMALFDRPSGTNTDKAQDAIRAALDLRSAIKLYNEHRANCNYPPVNMGIGIHFGPVILGTVGSDDRMDTTVIGDAVNVAFRLESLAPKYHTDIVVSTQVLQQAKAKGLFTYRLLDWVRVKGRKTPIEVYEIIDHQDPKVIKRKLSNAKLIEQGINFRKEQDWQQAITCFQLALEINDQDSLVLHHLAQCQKLQNIELGEDWDGSILLESS